MTKTLKSAESRSLLATRADIVRLLGDINDEELCAVLVLRPTIAEVETANAFLEGQGDVLDRQEHRQTPRIAAILDIVEREDDEPPASR